MVEKSRDLSSRLSKVPDISKVAKEDERIESYIKQISSDGFAPINTTTVDATHNREILLLVLNDLHIGSPGCNIDKIIRYLQEVKYIPNLYIVLNGDLMNNANNLGKSSPLENDLSPMNEQKVIHVLLSDPIIKSKIVCSTSGNHESGARARDSGLDSLVTPMATLGILDKYARYMAQVVFKVQNPYSKNGYSDFRVLVRHGSGMGGNSGKVIDTMFDKLKSFGQYDMVIQGHTHKNLYSVEDTVTQDNNNAVKRNVTTVNVPAAEEMNSYSTDYGYPPPNTDNFIMAIRAERNLDALDYALNDETVMPYKYIVDTISLDRLEFMDLASFDVKMPEKLTDEYIDGVARGAVKRVGQKAVGRRRPVQLKREEPENKDDYEDERGDM